MKTVYYEWVVEEMDEHDDIVSVNHHDTYQAAFDEQGQLVRLSGTKAALALVRDKYDNSGIGSYRTWAYVKNGQLPPEFTDSGATPTGVRVPQRFHDEVRKVKVTET